MKKVVLWMLAMALVLGLGTMGFAAASVYQQTLTVDQAVYQPGSMVKISGQLNKDGQAFGYGAVQIQVTDSAESLVYVKDLVAGQQGRYETSFRLADQAQGRFTVKAGFGSVLTTKTFEVGAASGLISDQSSYKQGSKIVLSGTLIREGKAAAYGSGIIKVFEKATGSLVFVKDFIADQNGRFSTEFKLAQTANVGEYTAKLYFDQREISLPIAVQKADGGTGSNTGGSTGGTGGSTGGGGAGSAPSGGGAPVQPAPKHTSTMPPVAQKGNTAAIGLVLSGVEVKEQKAAVVLGTEEIKQLTDSLKAVTAEKAEITLDLRSVKAGELQVAIPVTEIQAATQKPLSVVIAAPGVSVSVPLEGVRPANSKDQLSLTITKGSTQNMTLGQGMKGHETFTVKAQMTSGTGFDNKKMGIQINLSAYNLNPDKTVLVAIDANGKVTVAGGKIKQGQLQGKVQSQVTYAVVERQVEFSDIKAHWATDFVSSMASKAVVTGYEGGRFAPEKTVTRAEFVTMLIKAMDLELSSSPAVFKDVASDNWAQAYIQTAKANGIASGSGDQFKPNAQITRAEMAVMIANALKLSGKAAVEQKSAEAVPGWAASAIGQVMSEDLMKGSGGKFRPNDATTRAESATVIYKVFGRE